MIRELQARLELETTKTLVRQFVQAAVAGPQAEAGTRSAWHLHSILRGVFPSANQSAAEADVGPAAEPGR
jgi:hypothetical protein